MKKVILGLAFASVFGAFSANGQSYAKGDNVINLTVGFGSGVYNGVGYAVSPAFAISMEHCFWDDLINGDFSVGIGGYIGFQTSKQTWGTWNGDEYGYRYTSIVPAARGTFHWTGVDKLDTYAGVSVGGNIATSSTYGDWPGNPGNAANVGGGYAAPFVGARYYFTDAFCAVAEMGSGISYFNIGIGFKF